MKKSILMSITLMLAKLSALAQFQEQGILPAENGKPGEFTEWKKVEFTIGTDQLSYEYRIAFNKRKMLACYYEVQMKNTSTKKLKTELRTHYYDKLVKDNFGDKFKEGVKAGKEVTFLIITQGCKADKEKKDQADFERCRSCGLSYEIITEAD